MKMMNNKKNNRTSIVLGTIMIAIIAVIIICVEGAGFGLESKMIKSLADNIHENVPEAQTYKSKYRKANYKNKKRIWKIFVCRRFQI